MSYIAIDIRNMSIEQVMSIYRGLVDAGANDWHGEEEFQSQLDEYDGLIFYKNMPIAFLGIDYLHDIVGITRMDGEGDVIASSEEELYKLVKEAVE